MERDLKILKAEIEAAEKSIVTCNKETKPYCPKINQGGQINDEPGKNCDRFEEKAEVSSAIEQVNEKKKLEKY